MKKPALPLILLALTLIVGLPLLLSQIGEGSGAEAPEAMKPPQFVGVTDEPEEAFPEFSSGSETRDVAPQLEPDAVPGPRPRIIEDLESASAARLNFKGRVVGQGGAPVAGATVVVKRDWGLPDWSQGQDAESSITDSTGAFKAKWVSAEQLRLTVKASGFAPLNEKVQRPEEKAGADLGTFTLEPGVVLRGVVLDYRGSPVRGAGVSLRPMDDDIGWIVSLPGGSGNRGIPDDTTESDGSFELDSVAVGPWAIEVQHPEHPGARVSGLSEFAGVHPEQVLVKLPESGRISGFVEGYQADVECVVVATRRGDFDLRSDPNLMRQTTIATTGSFEMSGVMVEESYDLQVWPHSAEGSWSGDPLSEPVSAQAGDAGVVLEMKGPAGLSFRVVSAETGAPIEDFKAKAGSWWMQELEDSDGKVLTHHPDGRALFVKIDSPGGVETDGVSLHIAADGYSDHDQKGIQVVRGEVLDLGDIALEAAPILRVRVVSDATSEPVKGARVKLSGPTPQTSKGSSFGFSGGVDEELVFLPLGQQESRSGRTDAEGWVSLTTIPGVACTLKAQHGKYADLTLPMREYAGGEVEMRLLSGGAVRVLVLRADGAAASGVKVSHRLTGASRTESTYDSKQTNSKGEVVFRHLKAATHSFRLKEDRGLGAFVGFEGMSITGSEGPLEDEWADVEVAEGAELELVLHQAALSVLLGRVTEGGRALPGANLRLNPFSGEGDDAEARRMRMEEVVFLGGGGGVRTKGDGSYRMDEAEVGEYELVVSHTSRVMDEYVRVTLTPGEVELHVDLPSTSIEGVVVDQDGEPVEGVQVSVRQPVHQPGVEMKHSVSLVVGSTGGTQFHVGAGGDDGRIRTDGAGRFRMRGVASGCELELEVRGGNYQTETIEISPLRPDEVRDGIRVALTEGGGVEATLILADGRSPGFASIVLSKLVDGEPQGETRQEGAEGGKVRVEGLAPGEWRVVTIVFDLGNIAQRGEPDTLKQVQVVTVKAGEVTEALFQF